MGMFQTPGSNDRYGVIQGSRQRSVAASGSTQADAVTIGGNVSLVSGASGTNGAILSKAKSLGRGSIIYSSAATNALPLYPPVGGTINGGTVNASVSITARKPAIAYALASGIDFILFQSA